ncbi:MAG TPA: MEDS domain-containing protein [Desulfotignum sp.]|nr:MEDS domain-containing protein [Desulfotignum sp.]
MEKMLNVRQAAELLNVSQMTVRRWTNAGLLVCFRIGKKRERRFHLSDIQQFIEGKSPSSQTQKTFAGKADHRVALGFGGLDVPDGTHLAHLYTHLSESLGVQAFFVRQGIENKETVMVVSPQDRREKLLSAMEQDGLDVAELVRKNRLIHGSGRQSLVQMTEYISKAAASAQGRFRLIGDMSWTLQKKWSEENIRTLEEITNTRLCPGSLFLCQYSLAEFFGTQIMMALETHACALYKGKLKKNLL